MRQLLAGLLFFPAALAVGQDQKSTPEVPSKVPFKVDFSHFEKTYGLKCKNFELEDKGAVGVALKFLAEFERDLNSTELEDVVTIFRGTLKGKDRVAGQNKVRLLWIDKDNVTLHSDHLGNVSIRGDISGVKGDAFRVTVADIDKTRIESASRLVLRSIEKKAPPEPARDKKG